MKNASSFPFQFVLIVLGVLLCGGLYLREADLIEKAVLDREYARVEALAGLFQHEIRPVADDLRQFANGDGLRSYIADGRPTDLDRATRQAVFFSQLNPKFDQIRLLNEQGREVMRVNQNGQVVAPDDLQDKSDRPWFQRMFGLEPGQVFFSAFDLNMENGRVEQPPKPVVRLGMSVVDEDGRRRGVCVINYLAGGIFTHLKEYRPELQHRLRMFNAQGYWLVADEPGQEWGFMFPERRNLTLAQSDPDLWARLAGEPRGQTRHAGGVLTWYRVDLRQFLTDHLGSVVVEDAFIVIAAQISKPEFASYFSDLHGVFGILSTLLVVSGLVAGRLIRSRRNAERQLDRFFSLSPDILCIASTDGFFKRINTAATATLGWSPDEILARPFLDFVHPGDQTATVREVERLAAGKASHFENRYRCKDGSWKTLEWRCNPQPGGILYASGRDVTELRAATEAIRDSEALNRAVLNSIISNVAVVDRDGTIIAVNEGWERFGRENRADAGFVCLGVGDNYLAGGDDTARDLGDGAGEILGGLRSVLERSQSTFKHEHPCRSSTQICWFALHVSPLVRADGGAVIAQIDITERKRAEQVLVDFKAALDEHAIVAITGAEGRINYVNDKFCVISQYPREQLMGRDHRIINSGFHSKAFIRGLWETIKKGRVWKGEMRNRAKDGSFYWVYSTIVPFLDETGKPAQFIAIGTDITERKRIELALKEGEGRLRMATEAAEIGVWDWDPRTGAVKWDARMFGLYGLPPAPDGMVSFHDWLATVHSADVVEQEAVLRRTADTCGRSQREFRIVRASDQAVRVMVTAEMAITGSDGVTERVVGVNLDTTERKEAEERITKLAADLRVRAEELETVNKELESFSYSVSHDLRSPLRHVNGYVEMLVKSTAGQLPPKARRYLNIIADASLEMGQLIDDLLAFSRMGRSEMREATVDLNRIVQDTRQGLEMETKGRNITWKIAPLPAVSGDDAMLKQVFSNLVGNAVKYSRERDPAEIEIGCAGEERGRHILFVRDNGAGFDMRYAHKLFGVFQRLHRAEEFEGTGIGLATVQRILVRHGNRIWAKSAPDEGATFYFTLKDAT